MARLKKLKLFIATMAIIVVSASATGVLAIPNGPELTTNWIGVGYGTLD